MIEAIVTGLIKSGLDLDDKQFAELLWLAPYLGGMEEAKEFQESSFQRTIDSSAPAAPADEGQKQRSGKKQNRRTVDVPERDVGVYVSAPPGPESEPLVRASALGMPGATPLPGTLEIARALRPFTRRFPSRIRLTFDDESTVEAYAESEIWNPVLRPIAEHWFDVALVVDEGPSMAIWHQTIGEFYRLLVRHGAFRDVRRWKLLAAKDRILLTDRTGLAVPDGAVQNPGGRRMVMVVSDCVSEGWDRPDIWEILARWAKNTSVVLIQMLPDRMWAQTGAGEVVYEVKSLLPGVENSRLDEKRSWWDHQGQRIFLPVVTLEASAIQNWSKVVMGAGGVTVPAVRLPLDKAEQPTADAVSNDALLNAIERILRFRESGSSLAFRLAAYLSAVPLTLPVMRLVQRTMLPESRQVHLAEFFLGGLIEALDQSAAPEDAQYDFYPGVRSSLQGYLMRGEALKVLETISGYIAREHGLPFGFEALVVDPAGNRTLPPYARAFAEIGREMLQRIGMPSGPSTTQVRLTPEIEVGRGVTVFREFQTTKPSGGISWSWDGRMLSVAHNEGLMTFDVFTKEIVEELLKEGRTYVSVAWPPHSSRVAALTLEVGSQQIVLLRPGDMNEALWSWPIETGPAFGICWTSSPPALAVLTTSGIRYWDPEKRALLPIHDVVPTGGPMSMAPDNEGSTMAFVNDEGVSCGKVGSMRQVARIPVERTAENTRLFRPAIAWMRNAGIFATSWAVPYGVRIWSTSGDTVAHIPCSPVNSLSFSGDDSLLTALTLDGNLVFIDPQNWRVIHSVPLEALREADGNQSEVSRWKSPVSDPYDDSDSLIDFESSIVFAPKEPFLAVTLANSVQVLRVRREEFFGDYLSAVVRVEGRNQTALGVFVTRDGHIVTPSYWSADALKDVHIILHDGSSHSVEVLATTSELSILRVDWHPASFLSFSRDAQLSPDDLSGILKLIGFSSSGNSEIREARYIGTATAPQSERLYLQFSVEPDLPKGFGGGPVINGDGEIVAILYSESGGLKNCVPSAVAQQLLVQTFSDLDQKKHVSTSLMQVSVVNVVPQGEVTYKDAPGEHYGPFVITRGTHQLTLPSEFRIAVYPVTNQQFLQFVEDSGYSDDRYWAHVSRESFRTQDRKTHGPATWPTNRGCPSGNDNHPVAGVSFVEAEAFLQWLRHRHALPGWTWCMPSEDMWEFSARSHPGYPYPWGSEFHSEYCNSIESGNKGTTQVGQFFMGNSPYGCADMAGNVWEFVEAQDHVGSNLCVLRGGSFGNNQQEIKSYLRLTGVPVDHRPPDFGFRCAQLPEQYRVEPTKAVAQRASGPPPSNSAQQAKSSSPARVGMIPRFSESDLVGWMKSLFTWTRRVRRHPMLRPQGLQPTALPDRCRIAVLGDWGTGMYGAPVSARTISSDPNEFALLLHLGNVFYSGTPQEVKERFLDLWPKRSDALSRAVPGNHDMYSGGYGFFERILPAFQQDASYFAIQNNHWLLIGLDTSYEDADIDEEQLNWLQILASNAGARNIIFFSHHPFLSLLDKPAQSLQKKLESLLSTQRITHWYWAHEHRCIFYDTHRSFGLKGRCVGHGGLPVRRLTEQDGSVEHTTSDVQWIRVPGKEDTPSALVLDGPNPYLPGRENEYSPHGFLVIELDGPRLSETAFLPDGTRLLERSSFASSPNNKM
jgi:formylglycine-generating enzyme required for sulfatase activity